MASAHDNLSLLSETSILIRLFEASATVEQITLILSTGLYSTTNFASLILFEITELNYRMQIMPANTSATYLIHKIKTSSRPINAV